MKRLLCIVGVMDAGGAETFLMKIYRELDKSKYQMDFAVAKEENGFYDAEIYRMGGKIFYITPKSRGLIKNFNSIRKLVRYEQYEYVLRISQNSLSALELLAAKLGGAHVRIFRSSNSDTTGSMLEKLIHNICRFMPKLFATIRIAPSTEAAEFMFGKGCINSGEALIIHNAIDTDMYKYDLRYRKKIRDEFGLEDEYVIGHVGRFTEQKNHKYLIKVLKKIVSVNSKYKLLLVGNGELEEKIKNQVKALGLEQKVIFAGVRNDVNEILSAMDVFVFPSLYEGMPNTVIEAQAAGLHCVISDTITREANITGLIQYLPLGDVDKWAKTIMNSLNYQRQIKKSDFKKNGYEIKKVVEDFTDLIFS